MAEEQEQGQGQARADLAPTRALVGAVPTGVVAVLVGRKDRGVVGALRQQRPDLRIVRIEAGPNTDELDLALAQDGPYVLIVDDVRAPRSRLHLLRRALWHLQPGGHYVLIGLGAKPEGAEERPLLTRLRHLHAQTEIHDGDRTHPEADDLALGTAIGELSKRGTSVTIQRVGRSWPKVSEAQANALLARDRRLRGRILMNLAGESFSPSGVLRESPSPRAGQLPTTIKAPELSLREYAGAVCAPGQITTAEGLLLPDSFRHVFRRRLANRYVEDLAPAAGRPLTDLDGAAPLAGSYYQLDSEFRGHFGHALTEQLSRFWGWPEAKRLHPNLKALVASNEGRDRLAKFEVDLFAAAGIPANDIVVINDPVRVDHLIGATPMFGNPRYVHPGIVPVWAEVGANLEADAESTSPTPRRIFCSRRRTHRAPGTFSGVRRECHNGLEVEAMFKGHGFEIVFTEDLDLAEQARLFRNAEVVAGYAGSAMFNLVFCDRPTHVIVISSESYTAQNEYLIATAVGHNLDIAWCRPDVAMGARWSTEAFNSAFTLDFAREGAWLQDEVLSSMR